MKLDLNIGIGQKQGLNLTAQVQQAIKLLQMTNLELTEYIEENFVPNPFVELKDTTSSKKVEAAEPKATGGVLHSGTVRGHGVAFLRLTKV